MCTSESVRMRYRQRESDRERERKRESAIEKEREYKGSWKIEDGQEYVLGGGGRKEGRERQRERQRDSQGNNESVIFSWAVLLFFYLSLSFFFSFASSPSCFAIMIFL